MEKEPEKEAPEVHTIFPPAEEERRGGGRVSWPMDGWPSGTPNPRELEPLIIGVTGEDGGGGGGGGTNPAERLAAIIRLEVYVGAASVEGVRTVIYAVSKAAPAGTTVIMAPILADAALAAAAVFIGAYIIGELAAALQKAGLVKAYRDMLMNANEVGINSWEALSVSDFTEANQKTLEAKYNDAALTYLGNELYQPRWAAILPLLKKAPVPAV